MFTMISFPSPRLKKRRGKHSDGRQSTCYVCGNTPTADKVPDAVGWSTLTGDRVLAKFAEIFRRPTKYPMLQDEVLRQPTEYLLQLRKYYNGRQSTSAICASIVTADSVPDATEWNTLTADKVLATLDEALSRPTEYLHKSHRFLTWCNRLLWKLMLKNGGVSAFGWEMIWIFGIFSIF